MAIGRRIEGLLNRLVKLETITEIEEQPLVLASGELIHIGAAGWSRLFQKIDGKTRGIPSQQGRAAWQRL